MSLLHSQIFLLLLIIILGELLGKVRLGSITPGPAGIIFVALAFGHFGVTLPNEVRTVGLALFIYAVGLQSGSGFSSSFRRHVLTMALTVLVMVAIGLGTAYFCCWIFGFDAGTGAGLLAGAMTSTPSLAAAVEVVGHATAPAAYGVTYGFGVIGVVLAIKWLPGLLRIDIPAEEVRLARELAESNPPVTVRHFEVTNPNLFGKQVREIFLREVAPVTITRLVRKGGKVPVLVAGETSLREGDHLRVVGRTTDLEKLELYLGKPVKGKHAFERKLGARSLVVSRPQCSGTPLGYFNFREAFNIQVGHITRSGIDLPADNNTRLHLGDVLHVVGDEQAMQNVAAMLGNDSRVANTISLLPILIGLAFGLLLGRLTLTLPILGPMTIGTTTGTLIAGLLLGARYQTGPFIWAVPHAGNYLIRELGLALFLSSVGTSAGSTLVATLRAQGAALLVSGMLVTLLPVAVAVLIGFWRFRIRFLRLLGVVVGGMTNASGLAAASELSTTPYAPAAYATVYPVALVSKILAVKTLLLLLL